MGLCNRETQNQGLVGDARKTFMRECMSVARVSGNIKQKELARIEAIKTDSNLLNHSSASSIDFLAQEQWWGPERATKLTVNSESFAFSDLLGLKITENAVCAIHFQSFFGEETAHVFRGEIIDGKVELVGIRRIRGRMDESPRMELYAGATKMVQRLYVGGEYESRLFLLPRVAITLDYQKSVELNDECSRLP